MVEIKGVKGDPNYISELDPEWYFDCVVLHEKDDVVVTYTSEECVMCIMVDDTTHTLGEIVDVIRGDRKSQMSLEEHDRIVDDIGDRHEKAFQVMRGAYEHLFTYFPSAVAQNYISDAEDQESFWYWSFFDRGDGRIDCTKLTADVKLYMANMHQEDLVDQVMADVNMEMERRAARKKLYEIVEK